MWLSKPPAYLKIFQYLFLNAEWRREEDTPRGCLVTSWTDARGSLYGVSRAQWQRCMAWLRDRGDITSRRLPGNRLFIRIVNYDYYQDPNNYTRSPTAQATASRRGRNDDQQRKKAAAIMSRERAVQDLLEQLWSLRNYRNDWEDCMDAAKDKYSDFGRNEHGQLVVNEAYELYKLRRQSLRERSE